MYALGRVLMAARAEGLFALDGVHLQLDDDDGFRDSCHQVSRLGIINAFALLK